MFSKHYIDYLGYLWKTFNGMRVAIIFALFIALSTISQLSFSQSASDDEKKSLEKEFDEVAQQWHDISKIIDNYEGLAEYCKSPNFKNQVLLSLRRIHHFDSLIMDKIQSPSFVHENEKEEKKTLKSIEEFESEYRIPSFLEHLQDECDARHDIEKNRKNTANEIGSESYSGQVYLVELELYKYIHHIDKRLEHIEKHLHKIHIDDISGP